MSNIFEKLGVSEKAEKTTSLYEEAFSDELKAIYERLIEICAMKVVWHQGEISKAQKDLQHYENLLGKSHSKPVKTIKTSKALNKVSLKEKTENKILKVFAGDKNASISSTELLNTANLDQAVPYAAFICWLNGRAKGKRYVVRDKTTKMEGVHYATRFWKLTEEGKRKVQEIK